MEFSVRRGEACHCTCPRLVGTAAEVEHAVRCRHGYAVADGVRHLRVICLGEPCWRGAQDVDVGIGHLCPAGERSTCGEVRAASDDDAVAERPLYETRNADVLRVSCGGGECADRLPRERRCADLGGCGRRSERGKGDECRECGMTE